MPKLIIKNHQFNAQKKHPATFYVFLDNKPIGNVSGATQTLELDIPTGQHKIQIRCPRILGRSNHLTIHAEEGKNTTLTVKENLTSFFAIICSFIALYCILRIHFSLHPIIAAVVGIVEFYLASFLFPPILITQELS